MAQVSEAAIHLVDVTQAVPPDRRKLLQKASGLSENETAIIVDALEGASDDVAILARLLLGQWSSLTVAERVSGLLLLASRLGGQPI